MPDVVIEWSRLRGMTLPAVGSSTEQLQQSNESIKEGQWDSPHKLLVIRFSDVSSE